MISVMCRLLQLMASIIVFIIIDGLFVKSSADYYCMNMTRSAYCSNWVSVDYPFYYVGFSEYCGYPGLAITCSDEYEGRAVMNISNHLYIVQNIDYLFKSIRVLDVDIDGQECPKPRRNISLQSTPSLRNISKSIVIFYNCSNHPKDVVQNLPCLGDDHTSSFAFDEDEIPKGFNWYGNCEESVVVPSINYYVENITLAQQIKLGFDLSWSSPPDCRDCELSGGKCYFSTTKGTACDCNSDRRVIGGTCPKGISGSHQKEKGISGISTGLKVIIGVVTGVGGILLILIVIYRKSLYSFYCFIISHWRNKTKSPTNMEIFLESCGSLALQRYRYSDIKKMCNSFQETLGQGGFGSVFKGELQDGRLVAVKVLNESKGNGEDFINEVATIGRTNHVNVVSLLGFCTDGVKRALVYEFMSNGSLEKFIYNTRILHLGWEKLYQIALGIAKGLEYLHRGCNTRILHFDIKPHNILLDQDFCPKISDFGLAKLCPTRESVVSMVGARGTIGYIAPEVYCRNFGGVSHKSDVYSYGMMVLEMIGGRKNIDATVENTSEVYFPHWIYNHLKGDIKIEGPEDIKIEGSGETFEDETAKKMIIVSLWCIQTHPANRPSVSNVVDMLEGNIEDLQMPPNPFEDPASMFSLSSS